MTLRSILENKTQKAAAIDKQISDHNNKITNSYPVKSSATLAGG
jgi:hypothetical protein